MGIVEILENLRKITNQYVGTPRDLLEEASEKLHLAIFEASPNEVYDELKNMIWAIVKDSDCKSSSDLDSKINLTSLVEDICNNWEVDFENGPLDDESHWIWNDTYRALEQIGEELDNENSTD